ncbi:MAG: MerR family transcriptional regulator [Deltaproteobacteria bacterium]|nr:MerR family transcriptional regulator [Deltaproteobacteria bacterium]
MQIFSMSQLVRLSGVHRQTIHYYLREGLLPPPADGAGTRNARYSDRHLALLQLVRRLRSEEGLSLDAIRHRLQSAAYDPQRVQAELSGRPAPADLAPRSLSAEPFSATELASRANCTEDEVKAFTELGLLARIAGDLEERYEPEALSVLGAALELKQLGLDEAHVVHLAQLSREIGKAEVAALSVEVLTASGSRPSVDHYVRERFSRVGELVVALRGSEVAAALRALSEVAPRARSFAADAIYVPSPLFIERYGLDTELEHARRQVAAQPEDPVALLTLGRLLLGLGHYDEAARWCQESLKRRPRFAEAACYLGLTQALAGRLLPAVASCRRAVELAPESPRCRTFYGVVLAMHAVATTGLANATEVLQSALAEAVQSRKLPFPDEREELETLIARGRVLAVLPRELDAHRMGLEDLQQVLELTRHAHDGERGLEFSGSAALYRLHALFYLGVAAIERGDVALGREWLQECITIDPVSIFAKRAYEHLSSLMRR